MFSKMPTSSDVSSQQRPAMKACRREAANRVQRLLARWNAAGPVSIEEAEEALSQAAASPDKILHARGRLLVALTCAGRREPGPILQGLASAHQVFAANMLADEGLQAASAAASQLIAAGQPEAALQVLGAADEAHFDTIESSCQRLALHALACLDLGRLPEASQAARTALQLLDPIRVGLRAISQVQMQCDEVMLALRLHGVGLDTHLAMCAPRAESRSFAAGAAAAAESLTRLTRLPAGAELDHAALLLLERVAMRRAGNDVLVELANLVGRLAESERDACIAAWVRVGAAYRLAGHAKPAIECLGRAAARAVDCGQVRWAVQARFELARALAAENDFAAAYRVMAALHEDTAVRVALPPRPWPASFAPEAQMTLQEDTSQAPQVAALHVRRAQKYIGERLSQGVSVSEVAAHCGVSRRTLETAFRAVLNTTLGECIREHRLREVKRRLARTNHPIGRIAQDLAYSTGTSLSREFRRATGITPGQYRLTASDA